MEKPKKIYRGIKLHFDKLKDFDFDAEIGLPFNFTYRADGMKLVSDGNEYGIYMSDNFNMPLAAYGNSTRQDGTEIEKGIIFGMGRDRVVIPPVCIIYEIDTDGIEIKEPWIDPKWNGHYNNGFEGKEWITQQPIPRENYRYKMIKIGEDHLHPEERIEIGPEDDIKKILIQKYSERNQRLNAFLSALKTMTEIERLRVDMHLNLMVEIFQEDGIAYKKPADIKVIDSKTLRDKLILKQLSRGFNLKVIRNIDSMCSKLDDKNLYGSLAGLLKTGFKDVVIMGMEEVISKNLQDLGATYCHFSNGNAHVLLDGYNIKMSIDGDVQISKFNEEIKLEDLLLNTDCESNFIKSVINLLEDLRIERSNFAKDEVNIEEQR